MRKRRVRFVVLLVAALLFFLGPSMLGFYTDWLWFGELGYPQVFTTMLRAQTTTFTIVFAVSALWLAANLNVALRAVGDARPVFTTREGLEVVLPGRQQLRGIALGIAVVTALLIALYASSRWLTWISWYHAVPFGHADPILGHDVGFYVFSLPVLQLARGLGQALVILAAIGAGIMYFVSGTLGAGFGTAIRVSPGARRHLGALAAVFFLLLAFGAWLERAELLTGQSGIIHGASYADVHGRMPAALALVAAGVIGAGLAVYQAMVARNWPIAAAVAVYAVTSAAPPPMGPCVPSIG